MKKLILNLLLINSIFIFVFSLKTHAEINLYINLSGGNKFITDTTYPEIKPQTFTLKTGKSFTVLQAQESDYLYDVWIIGNGFSGKADTILLDELEHIDTIIIADINNDSFEELYFFTHGFLPGAYGHVFGITSDRDISYKEINFPDLKPEEINKGGIFEGYNGKDVYIIRNNTLERVFPVYKPGDTYENPTGGKKTIYYTIEKTSNGYFYKIKE